VLALLLELDSLRIFSKLYVFTIEIVYPFITGVPSQIQGVPRSLCWWEMGGVGLPSNWLFPLGPKFKKALTALYFMAKETYSLARHFAPICNNLKLFSSIIPSLLSLSSLCCTLFYMVISKWLEVGFENTFV